MQYLLTENEFLELNTARQEKITADKQALLEFCILAAKHIPVARYWAMNNNEPWGCILDNPKEVSYCDGCPARKFCPNDHKNFSK